jgi:predicted metal-dependent hydrolase
MTQAAALHASVSFGERTIAFEVTFSRRKTLAISVHPDRRVTVAAPQGRALEEVRDRVRRRAGWIVRQQEAFERFQPVTPPRRYVSGETHLYLGRQYRLKVASEGAESVKLSGGYLRVSTSQPGNAGRVRSLLEGWYRERAQVLFARRLQACFDSTRFLEIAMPEFRLRTMSTRWGSCTKARAVLLNPRLVRAPLPCVDYVITHELCHLKVMNHGPEFYRLLGRCLPNWRERKARLDGREW